jgi:hypothetical protein
MKGPDKSALILGKYGPNLKGKSYSEISRELGVSRPLVHHVLAPIHGRSRGKPLNKKYLHPLPQPTTLSAAHVDALSLVAQLFNLEPGDLVEIERLRAGGWGFKIISADERMKEPNQ